MASTKNKEVKEEEAQQESVKEETEKIIEEKADKIIEEKVEKAVEETVDKIVEEKVETAVDAEEKKKLAEKLNKPMSTFNYFFTIILLIIPIIGFVFSLVWAFTPGLNKNRKNLASAFLLFYIIGVGLIAWTVVVFGPELQQNFDEFATQFSEELKQIQEIFKGMSNKQNEWPITQNLDPNMTQNQITHFSETEFWR